MKLKRSELLDLRATVALAQHHIKTMPRGQHRLDWTRMLRRARQVTRRLTHDFLDGKTENPLTCR